jgi:predicted RecA/RadA family phage recombinase
MKNFILEGDTLTVPAPTGGVVSGGLVIIGLLIGVATTTQPQGAPVAVKTRGVFEFPKVSAQAWAQGQAIYWDPAANNATTSSTSTTLIGYATEVAANPSAVGRVRLIPRAA